MQQVASCKNIPMFREFCGDLSCVGDEEDEAPVSVIQNISSMEIDDARECNNSIIPRVSDEHDNTSGDESLPVAMPGLQFEMSEDRDPYRQFGEITWEITSVTSTVIKAKAVFPFSARDSLVEERVFEDMESVQRMINMCN